MAGSSQYVVRTSGGPGVSWTPLSAKGGAEMEKPVEEGLGVAVAGGGACRPNKLGRVVPRRLAEPPARLSMDGSIVEIVLARSVWPLTYL
jgi:hypothetical protein